MSHLRSLRSRLLLGSILWTIGLFFVAHMLAIFLVHWYFGGRSFTMSRSAWQIGAVIGAVVALGCMALGFLHVRRGLSSLERIRVRLAAVRDGRERRLEGEHPIEVQPLVHDLNALLDHREAVVRRALAKAGDLAHGLKTPLAVLDQEAERCAASGQVELAANLRQQLDRMQRQVDYHLAQARAAAAGATLGTRCAVAESAEALARTLARLQAGKGLTLLVQVPAEHAVRCQREDLEEMLGNLLDNACKWARSRVTVGSSLADDAVEITVDDDGPGLPPELRQRVLERGVRADQAAPGSGLGLAIVRDLAELYGGSIALTAARDGGVRAQLRLPAA